MRFVQAKRRTQNTLGKYPLTRACENTNKLTVDSTVLVLDSSTSRLLFPHFALKKKKKKHQIRRHKQINKIPRDFPSPRKTSRQKKGVCGEAMWEWGGDTLPSPPTETRFENSLMTQWTATWKTRDAGKKKLIILIMARNYDAKILVKLGHISKYFVSWVSWIIIL